MLTWTAYINPTISYYYTKHGRHNTNNKSITIGTSNFKAKLALIM